MFTPQDKTCRDEIRILPGARGLLVSRRISDYRHRILVKRMCMADVWESCERYLRRGPASGVTWRDDAGILSGPSEDISSVRY